MYKSRMWDKKTPINGNSVEKVMSAYRINESQPVGLIYDEENAERIVLIISNPNYTKADVTRVVKEQLTALNAESEVSVPQTDE